MTNILDSHINSNANILAARKLKGKNIRNKIVASDSIEKYDLEKVLEEQEKFRNDVLALSKSKEKTKKKVPIFTIIITSLASFLLYKKVKKWRFNLVKTTLI